ncbi:MAG: glucoamylase family protein [Planctomycetota bacterium]
MGHEQAFLTDLQKRCYQYFLDAADPSTGLIADRGSRDGTGFSRHASSAACGFALAAHAIAPTAKLATSNQARDRIRQLLRSLVDLSEHHRGFVYHFVDQRTGRRALQCEASSVDTALMLAGVMCAQTTFADDHDINAMSDELIRRTDWQAMLGDDDTLHMGWRPEEGLLPHRWDRFSELTILVLMAIGAPTNAIGKHCWHAWRRDHTLTHQGESFLSYPPLFVHQYPMAFFDFRNVRSPSGRDYFRNSVVAHHAQIEFLTQLGRRYPSMQHYGNDLWGITSSDSVTGYRDWGGPYEDDRFEPDRGIDGTLVPSAAAGGLAIVPTQALHTLRVQHERFGDAIYGRYGFANAFNPANGWVSPDCIGIDTGITLLMAENRLRGGVWNAFMRHAIARAAFDRVGFRLVAS